MVRSLVFILVVAVMVGAWTSEASAQVVSPGASPEDRCAVVGVALERLTGFPSTTFSAPALATPQAGASTGYTGSVVPGRGFEISAGTFSGDIRFGATFVGDVSGGLPGVLFTSVNYTPPSPGAGVTNLITGGEWALCGSWGILFGTFTDGTVQWNADGSLAGVVAGMMILGGSINGIAVPGGTGTFGGTLDHTPLAQGLPPTIGGTLRLEASAAPATELSLPSTGGPGLWPLLGALLFAGGTAGIRLVLRRSP